MVFAKSDIGKIREQNQDYYYIPSSDSDLKLYILADGMGGCNAGEIASKLAVQTAKNYIENNKRVCPLKLPKNRRIKGKNIRACKTGSNICKQSCV